LLAGNRQPDEESVVSNWYEIHVHGTIPAEVLPEFEDLSARVEPAETVLAGDLPDQAALFGVLARLQSLGLELVEMRRVPTGCTSKAV
jgi:hypothetical protein